MVVPINPLLRFPYVLFDLGGTLIYFQGNFPAVLADAIHQAQRYLREAGYALEEQEFAQAYRVLIEEYSNRRSDGLVEYTAAYVLREALHAHGVADPQEAHITAALKRMYAVLQAHWHREADALATLEALAERGCRMGIVSNASDDADVQTLVDNAGLRGYFDFILTSAVAGFRKPDPRIFQQALAFWDAHPSKTVMVGDTVPADISGARDLGIASVWTSRRGDTADNRAALAVSPPDATILTLSELPGLLAHWPD